MRFDSDLPTAADFEAAASRLGCEVAAIRAVAEVEAGRHGAFLDSGEPVILFERHKFSAATGGRFDKSHPHLSNPKPGGYGSVSRQHFRLQEAVALDREAALKSTSWGLFQILGSNFEAAGFGSVQAFVTAMIQGGVRAHLEAFVSFILADRQLLVAIRELDWRTFARIYNGPGYARNRYDTRLAEAHERALRGGP